MIGAYSEHYHTTADGPRVHYRVYEADGRASGAPVLCLHGLTRNERDFEALAPMIAALGRRVVVVTQRGRGLSDPDPDAARYAAPVYVADSLAILDALAIPRAVWIGTSMGGGITMVSAAMAPQRLAAAVLNDVGPEIDPVGLERIRGYAGVPKTAATWAGAAALCREINGVAFPDEGGDFWETFARRICRQESPGRIVLDYDPRVGGAVAPDGPRPDLWPVFDALKPIPTLVIRGEITDVLMTSTVDEMRRRKPDLVVASVPRVGHAPFMTEPAAWAALSAFLERVG